MNIKIFHTNLYFGGIERSLVNLANELINHNDVEIVLFNKEGELLNELDSKIKVSVADKKLSVYGISRNKAKNKSLMFRIRRDLASFLRKKVFREKRYDRLCSKLKSNYQCDVAIAYTDDSVVDFFVLNNVSASKKFVFYHSDFRNKSFKNDDYYKRAERFDKFICVSKSCANITKQLMPRMADKVDYLYNIIKIPTEVEGYKYNNDAINIVTVSRLSSEKRLDWAVELACDLRKNFNICLHIIGDGDEYNNLKRLIKLYNASEYIKMYGAQANPFQFMKSADLLLLLSRTESFGMVLVESMLLGTPCLTTKTISAEEIVDENRGGWICLHDKNEIYERLNYILSNPKILKEKKENLLNFEFSSKDIVMKFNKLCED